MLFLPSCESKDARSMADNNSGTENSISVLKLDGINRFVSG